MCTVHEHVDCHGRGAAGVARSAPMRLAVCFSVLLAAPAFADRIDVGPPHEPEVLAGNVLVWQDATLYTDTAESAQQLRIANLDGGRRVGRVVPMHVLATKGELVEVEPVNEPDCTSSRVETTDDVTHLRLFVKRADLAQVLSKPYSKEFDDGTRIVLRPGVAVVPAADGLVTVSIRGNELAVEIPAASIGHAYKLDKVKSKAISGHDFGLAAHTTVTLGGRSLSFGGVLAASVEHKGATTLFAIEDRCVALTVAAPSKAVKDSDEEDSASVGAGSGMGVLDLRNEDFLPTGTPLSAGTHQVAIAARPIYLPGKPSGKTVCIDRRIRLMSDGAPGDLDDKLHLCAPTAKVVHEKMRSASSANGTTGR